MRRLRDVVDRGEAGFGGFSGLGFTGIELDVPDLGQSGCSGSRKYSRLPPMPRTAGISNSPGPTFWRNGVSCSFSARSSAALALSTFSPMAQTDGPCVM